MHKQKKKRALRALIVATLSVVFVSCGQSNLIDDPGAATVKSTLQSEPTVTEHDGNPTCSDFNANWVEFKVDGPDFQDGTYTSPDGYLTIEVTNEDDLQFDFTTDVGIDAVFVKGGPGGVLYSFDPEGMGWDGLTSARDRDYAISHVSFCYDIEFARIAIEPSGVNEAGDPHTFIANVEQKIGLDGEWGPVDDGTAVDVNLIPSNGALPVVSSNSCEAAGGGTVGGLCEVTFTSNGAGIITGHAVTDVVIDNATLHVETDGEGENSADAVKRFVDATISIAASATNEVGAPHTFTVTAMVDAGNGSPGPVPDGTKPVVTLKNMPGANFQVISDTCETDGTRDGQCSVTFTSASAGTVQGSASMTVDVDDFTIKRATDGTGGNSAPALKGFVDAVIEIAPSGTNDVRHLHTFTVTAFVEGTGGMIAAVPDGTLVTVDLGEGNGAVIVSKTDNCATTGTSGGSCSVTFKSDTAGLITGHATMDLVYEGVTLHRETDGVAPNSGDAVKRYVDGYVTITPSATNGINEQHTFTINAKQDDGGGGGFVGVPDGTTVDVTLQEGGAASATGVQDTCATGTTNGTCTVTFTSTTSGTVTGHATVSLDIRDITIVRETDGVKPNSADAVKEFVDGYISWTKYDDNQALLGGATFEVCRTHDYLSSSATFSALSSPVCMTVTDMDGPVGPSGDQNAAAGEIVLDGLRLGRYTVKETAAPSGYTADSTVRTVELTTANPSENIATAFVNTQERPSGCTPGFWKNHTDLWDNRNDAIAGAAGFNTKTKFNDFFGLDEDDTGFKGNFTMEDAIGVGGGGGAKLARHGVAALLNMASGYAYDYGTTAESLKADIKAAYESGTFEPLATNLDTANNVGCLVQ